MKLIACHVALLVACSDPPPEVIAITLDARSSEVPGPGITLETPITSEPGDPYSAFISAAEARLGKESTRLDIERLTLQLGESTNVTTLEQVCTGNLSFELTLLEGTHDTYVFGQAKDPSGAGPVAVTVTHRTFTPERDGADDFGALRRGRFKVVLHASAGADFPTRNAEARLILTFTMAAL